MPPEAAQLVVQKIVSQALQNGVPLSEVERKMLFFSETSPTLPDIAEMNETFDHDYDRLEYENKIANLIRDLRLAERQNPEANRSWNEIIRSLRGKDYYFMVMLNEACGQERSRGDLIRLLVTALVIVGVILGIASFFTGR
jgi:hypothetical protein